MNPLIQDAAPLPTDAREMIEHLEEMTFRDFDQSWVAAMVAAHQEDPYWTSTRGLAHVLAMIRDRYRTPPANARCLRCANRLPDGTKHQICEACWARCPKCGDKKRPGGTEPRCGHCKSAGRAIDKVTVEIVGLPVLAGRQHEQIAEWCRNCVGPGVLVQTETGYRWTANTVRGA